MLGNLRIKLNTAPSIIIFVEAIEKQKELIADLKSQELNFMLCAKSSADS